MNVAYKNGLIFDGECLRQGCALLMRDGVVQGIVPEGEVDGEFIDLGGDILAPGYVDLQVNGGGGLQFNASPTPDTLATIAQSHRALGATTILPTLITDAPDVTRKAIEAAIHACNEGMPGIGGLHLEGPHLSSSRKGAHEAGFIRPMTEDDLSLYLRAAAQLPALMMTVAPENVQLDQVRQLSAAGVVVSLGHSDTDFGCAMGYQEAGARAVTHLFNAMSQLGNREPGLVGAALANEGLSAGLIADGIHVHPETIRAAWAAKHGAQGIFLVSDSMAVAGSNLRSFSLNDRVISREDGRLTLEDGTLAGADLSMTRAVEVLVETVDVDLGEALAAATNVPARLMAMPEQVGTLRSGMSTDVIRISSDLTGCSPLN